MGGVLVCKSVAGAINENKKTESTCNVLKRMPRQLDTHLHEHLILIYFLLKRAEQPRVAKFTTACLFPEELSMFYKFAVMEEEQANRICTRCGYSYKNIPRKIIRLYT